MFKSLENVDSIQADIILSEAYDIAYNIFNHDGPEATPLSIVAYHKAEDYDKLGRTSFTIRRYHNYDINDRFGLSLSEFLSLPRDMVEMLFEIAAEKIVEDNEHMESVQEELRETIRELKQQNANRKPRRAPTKARSSPRHRSKRKGR